MFHITVFIYDSKALDMYFHELTLLFNKVSGIKSLCGMYYHH